MSDFPSSLQQTPSATLLSSLDEESMRLGGGGSGGALPSSAAVLSMGATQTFEYTDDPMDEVDEPDYLDGEYDSDLDHDDDDDDDDEEDVLDDDGSLSCNETEEEADDEDEAHHDHSHIHSHIHSHAHGHVHSHGFQVGSSSAQSSANGSVFQSTRDRPLGRTSQLISAVSGDHRKPPESQQELRKRIMVIQQDTSIPPAEKAKKIQELMTTQWTTKQKAQSSRANVANKLDDKRADFDLVTEEDKQITYHNKELGIIGCSHYQRSAKLQAHCCGKWFTCRFCHDEISDHNIIRNLTTTMMCMYCSTVQPAGQQCINTACGRKVSKYYCHECKLWDDDPKKNIYHCYDCGICRIGKGLGIDYFHCKKCNVCMAISLKNRHKCIERNLESDCPICGEYMFTSTTTVIFMPCGHCIHYKCHQEYIHTSYQCPTCFKSLANMTEYFRRIDAMLEQHQMPPEYAKTVSHIYCNDCEKRSDVKFHFLYHKCGFCSGYNTKVLRTSEKKSIEPEPTTDTDGTKPLSDQSAALDDAAKAPNAAVSSEATSLASSSTPSSSSSQADLNEGLNDVTTTFTYQTRSAASRGSVSRTLTRLFSDQN